MRAAEVLLELIEQNVEVKAIGGHLHLRHAEEALSPGLLARIREQKPAILHLLAEPDKLRLALAIAMFDAEIVEDDILNEVTQLDLIIAEENR